MCRVAEQVVFGGVFPLKVILMAVGSLAILCITLLVSYAFRELTASSLTEQIGNSAAVLADQLEYKLESDLLERSRHLEATSRSIAPVIGGERSSTIAFLEQTRANYDDLIWVAVFDLQGHVLGESGFQPQNVGQEKKPRGNSFLQAAIESNRVHGQNVVLAPLNPGQDGPGYVELATPVLGPGGIPIAILTAYFNWDWAEELGRTLGGHTTAQQGLELLVVTNEGRVLVGPALASGDIRRLPSFAEALKATNGFKVESWPDAESYVTGFSKSKADSFVDGQDLIILVRQNAAAALAPVTRVQHNALTYAIIFGLHAILIQWLLAAKIVDPLLQLSKAADELRGNSTAKIPEVNQFTEVKVLSTSLISLVKSLQSREQALAALSSSLERQVAERTEMLAEQNLTLEDARKVAEQATAAKSRFLAAASHDLRQPLQAMGLFANALNKRLAATDNEAIAKNLEESIASLRGMLDAVLHISRLEAGLVVGELTQVSLRAALSGMTAEFQVEADHRGLDFRCSIPDLYVMTDRALFDVVMRNIVSNALKFTKRGGILIAARPRGDSIVIDIYDTGPGIDADAQANIFGEFERAKMQATGPNDGLGLGLSIAERYARVIGAEITVRSRLGAGTRFSLIVPKATGIVRSERVAAKLQPKLPGLHVMLLDDNAKEIQSLTLLFEDLGAVVTSFETAEKALHALKQGLHVDVAIVDFDLGGPMTGLEFLDDGHAGKYDFEPIILTGRTDAVAIAAMNAQGRTWINKPAAPETIAAMVRNVSGKVRDSQNIHQNIAF